MPLQPEATAHHSTVASVVGWSLVGTERWNQFLAVRPTRDDTLYIVPRPPPWEARPSAPARPHKKVFGGANLYAKIFKSTHPHQTTGSSCTGPACIGHEFQIDFPPLLVRYGRRFSASMSAATSTTTTYRAFSMRCIFLQCIFDAL